MHYQPKSDLLDHRIILVTGASDGIGREAALTYARYGARVILLGRNAEKLQRVSDDISALGKAAPLIRLLDLAEVTPESCRQFADELAQQVPRLDGVLHNAGLLGEIVPLADLAPEIWQQVMRVNVDATFS